MTAKMTRKNDKIKCVDRCLWTKLLKIRMCVHKMIFYKLKGGEMSADKSTIDKMTCGQWSLTLDKTSVDDMTVENDFRQNDSKWDSWVQNALTHERV